MSGAVEVYGNLVTMLEEVYRVSDSTPRPWWLWQESNGLHAARDRRLYDADGRAESQADPQQVDEKFPERRARHPRAARFIALARDRE